MDHDSHNRSDEPEPASTSRSKTDGEDDNVVPVRASKLAKKELQRIKDELSANLELIQGGRTEGNKMSTLSGWSQEDTCNSTIRTDMTVSDVTPLGTDVTSLSVIYEAPKTTGEPVPSCNNLIPDYEGKIVGRSEFDCPRMAVKEEKRLTTLKAVFDSIPTVKPSRSQLEKEFTENRIQSHKKICELNAEVTVKSKESEFLELQLARNHTELRAAKSEIAIKDAENKKLRRAMAELESKSSKQILDLTLELQQKAAKLETYKRLYSQMDLLTHVDSVDPERWTPGESLDPKISMSVPTNFKFKLQQSMDLAQRLKEERNHLERSRDETERKLKETEAKYQGILIELNKLKLGEDMKLTNTKASLQLKCFELERANLILEDYQQKNRVAISENEELKRKIERLHEELNEARCELNEELTRLSLELQSKSSKLELYESIEDALDEMILKAATVPNTNVGQDLLSFCSHGPSSLPTDARRRLQQAFDLAKKNCELQKAVAEQKEEILTLYDERQALRQEVQTVKSLNGYSVGQLIETITEKNREIGKLNKRISSIERDFSEAKQSKEVLQQTVDNLKEYHDQVLTLFHSGARISQVKSDRKEAGPVSGGTTTTDYEAVSATSSLHLLRPRTERLSQSSAASGSIISCHQSQKTSTSRKSVDSSLRSMNSTNIRYVPEINGQKLMEPANWIRNSELRVITEEPSDEIAYKADSLLMESDSSLTSSMFAPPPPMVRTRSPITVSVRKIPSRSLTSTRSSKSSKKNARQVASADLITEQSKKKDKPVALRLTKVKPSASNFF